MIKKMRKPKAALVPFGYPGYPDSYLNRFTRESIQTLKKCNVDLVTTPIIKVFADSRKAAEALRKSDFDFLIVLVLSWLEAPNVIELVQEFTHKPILLWSHTMFKEGGMLKTLGPIPGVGVIRQNFEELGLNFKFIYGMPQEAKVKKGIETFSKAASVMHQLRHTKIGLLGYISMGMYTAAFDHLPLKEKLGPEVEQLDQYVLIKKIEEMKDSRVQNLVRKAKKEWSIGAKVTDRDLTTTLKMYQVLKDMVKEFDWQALQIKCQYELSKYFKSVPCVSISMLANELPASCEGDIPLITTQLILHYLTGKIASYGDIHTVEDKSILIGACGYAPFDLCDGKPKVDKTDVLYEGVANCTLYKPGRVTLARLGYQRDRNFKLHLITGQAKKPRPFQEIGCLPYPAMEVTLDGEGEPLAQNLTSQHYAIVYDDAVTEPLLELSRLLSITPILNQPRG